MISNPGSAVPVAEGVAMLKPPETGRSRREQALDETESTPPVESAERSSKASLETPDAAETKLLDQLKRRDREVRAHEQAHAAAAGRHAVGGPVYEYQRGPDGRSYAVGGHVKLDTSPVAGDPEATLQKAGEIRRAAMAPAEPSAQDRQIAAEAAQMAVEARVDLQAQRAEESRQARKQEASAAAESDAQASAAAEASEASPDAGAANRAQAAAADADAGSDATGSVSESSAATPLGEMLRASGALPENQESTQAALDLLA